MADESAQDEGDQRGAREKVGDGIRQGIGVLSAFKDALEETINDARERGDLSAERAKEVMKGALERAQAAASGAREKLDFVSQAELETLKETVDEVRRRVAALEDKVFGGKGD
jgi:polyhydroxyalkanoate synthesis regulator phasin